MSNPGQMSASSKPVGRIRSGDTVVCNLNEDVANRPKNQERCTVKAFYPNYVTLEEYPDWQIPIALFRSKFNFVGK